MNKIINIFFLCYIFTGCHPQRHSKDLYLQEEDSIYIIKEEPLFHVDALNDTLRSFMKSVGDISNPLNAPKFNNLILGAGNDPSYPNDTIVTIIAQLTPYEMSDIFPGLILKGACKIDGEYMVVYYYYYDMSHIVNEDILDLEYLDEVVRNIPMDTISNPWYYNAQVIEYKLSGDSLRIKRERMRYLCTRFYPIEW